MAKHKYIETPEKMKSKVKQKLMSQEKDGTYYYFFDKEIYKIYKRLIKLLPSKVSNRVRMFTKYTR